MDIILIDQIMKKYLFRSSFLHTIHQHEINMLLALEHAPPWPAGTRGPGQRRHVFAGRTAAEEPLASLRELGSPVENRDPC